MTKYVKLFLAEPFRSQAAKALDLPVFTGPRFENPRAFLVHEGCAIITDSLGEHYYYPLHTIARIKEIK